MSHSQFHSIKSFILRHAWLNLWDKRMLLAESTRLLSLFVYYADLIFQVLHGVDYREDCYPMRKFPENRYFHPLQMTNISLLPSFFKQAHNNTLLLSRFRETSIPIMTQEAFAEYNYYCRDASSSVMREKWMCDDTEKFSQVALICKLIDAFLCWKAQCSIFSTIEEITAHKHSDLYKSDGLWDHVHLQNSLRGYCFWPHTPKYICKWLSSWYWSWWDGSRGSEGEKDWKDHTQRSAD